METTTVRLCTSPVAVKIHLRPASVLTKFGLTLKKTHGNVVDLIMLHKGAELQVGTSITGLLNLGITAGTEVKMLLRFPEGHPVQDKLLSISNNVRTLLMHEIGRTEHNTTPSMYNPDLDPNREETKRILDEILQKARQIGGGDIQEWTDRILLDIEGIPSSLKGNLAHCISGGYAQYREFGDTYNIGPDVYMEETLRIIQLYRGRD